MNSVKTYAVLNFIIKSKSNRNMIPQTNREVLWTQQARAEGGAMGAWAPAPFPLDGQSALLSRQFFYFVCN